MPSRKGLQLIILHAGGEDGLSGWSRPGIQVKDEHQRLPRRVEWRALYGVDERTATAPA